jgi:quercetin dioxygenase-like cupin family protein
MTHRVLAAADAFWRPSNQLGIQNTDIAKQLECEVLGARLWRLAPGEWSTQHRHLHTSELYLVVEGTGRMRVDGEVLTLEPLSSVLVAPETVRQIFNDTESEQLWFVVGAPVEQANTLVMTPELLARIYPGGPKAPPPELA